MSNIHFELFKFMNDHGDKTQDVRKSVMTDREKVIKGWECHMEADMLKCADCPYREGWRTCNYADTLYKDVYDLLKEQGTEWEHLLDAPDGTFKGRCKKCGFVHFFIEGHDTQYKFCPGCGRSVK